MPKDITAAINSLIDLLSTEEAISKGDAINLLRKTRELKSELMLEISEKVPLRNDTQSASADRLFGVKTHLNETVQRLNTRLRGLQKRESAEIKEEWASFAFRFGNALGAVVFDLQILESANKDALKEKGSESAEERLERLQRYQSEADNTAKRLQKEMDEAEEMLRIQIRDNDSRKKELFDNIIEAQDELEKMADEAYQGQLNKIEMISQMVSEFETAYLN